MIFFRTILSVHGQKHDKEIAKGFEVLKQGRECIYSFFKLSIGLITAAR